MEVFLARQPIFDRKQTVFGYELLYRSSRKNVYSAVDGDKASLAVLHNALLVIGSQQITGGRKAFINFTRNLLLNGAAAYLPKEIGIIEILEDIEPDKHILITLARLRHEGYPLALDDFILRGNEHSPFLKLADLIKVDFRQTDPGEREAIARRFPAGGRIKLLAEKVETREELAEAIGLGYSYFQGFFFSRPVIISRRDISGHKLNYLRILKETSAESPDFKAIRLIIQQDPSLTYKLLKYINSTSFGLRREVSSIRHALDLLGEAEIRRWASLAVLMELGRDQPQELLRLTLLRARFCEQMATAAQVSARYDLFFLGLFSCMDVLLGRPMVEVLADMPIPYKVKEALLGGNTEYRSILDLVLCYEKGDWKAIESLSARLGISGDTISEVYTEAVCWSDRAFQ